MQLKVNAILEANELTGANEPLGLWKYGQFEALGDHVMISNECKHEIDKYCGIFRTLGDRRLQTNLFQGLHRLIKEVVKASATDFTPETVASLIEIFQGKQRYNAETGKVKEAWQMKIFRLHEKD